jgi:uncharacterized protein (DUF2235 family)
MGEKSEPTPVQIVLCFDGTGNTFRADGTETNILKICRMLPRTDHQCEHDPLDPVVSANEASLLMRF